MNAYYIEPGLALSDDQRVRLAQAVTEVERAVRLLEAPNGLRIFDAYITTMPPDERNAGAAYVLPPRAEDRSTRSSKRRSWWRRRRDR